MVSEWSQQDEAFIVTVPELPGCMTYGATYGEAVAQGEAAIQSWLGAARARGRPIPQPRTFSGVRQFNP